MSLLVDPDYLIHSLRLAYLRRVDDSHGPRVINFPSIAVQRTEESDGADGYGREELAAASGSSRQRRQNQNAEAAPNAIERLAPDSHVVLAGLSNPARFPELAACYSPKLAVAEPTRPARSEARGARTAMTEADGRLPGPGLKHTQTIYGPGRTGALGMRVSGIKSSQQPSARRRSTASLSDEPHAQDLNRFAFGRRASHGEGSWQRAARGQGSTSEGGTSPSPGQTAFTRQLVPQLEVSAATVEASGSQTGARLLKKASPFDAPPMLKELRHMPSPEIGGKRSLLETIRQRRSSSSSSSLASDRRGSIPTLSSEAADPNSGHNGAPIDPSLGRERSSSDADVDRQKGSPLMGSSRGFELPHGRRRSASEGASGFFRASNGSIETVRNNAGRRRSSARPSRPPSVLREVDAEDSDDEDDEEAQGYEASSILARRAAIEEAMQQSDSDGEIEMYRAPVSRIGQGPDMTMSKSDSGFSLASLPANRPRRSLDRLMIGEGMTRIPRHVFTPVTELEEPVFPVFGQGQLSFGLALPEAQTSLSGGINETLAARYPASSEEEDGEARSAMAQQFLSPFDADRKIQGAAMGASMDTSQVGSLKGDPSPSWDPPDSQGAYRPLTAAESSLSPSIHDELGLAGSPTDVAGRPTSQHHPAEIDGMGRSGDESSAQDASLPSASDFGKTRNQTADKSKAAASTKGTSQAPGAHRNGLRSRSRAQRERVASTNEWFRSLKSDAAAVKARNAKLPQTSALSAILKKQSAIPENPFAALYAGVAGRAVSAPGGAIEVDMYLPFAKTVPPVRKGEKTKSGAVSLDARAKSMRLSVRKDATMEELTGYALYCYVEEEWQPALDEGINPHDDEALDVRLTTVGWTMRIVEDGEVDDDYPAIDRSLTVGKFGADELAVCEATPAQIAQHRSAPGYVKRTRTTGASGSVPSDATSSTPGTGLQPPASVANPTATGAVARLAAANNNAPAGSLINIAGTPIFASSALSRSANGPASTGIFLRVLVTPNPAVRYKTTLQVPSDMYLADVLETICRKRQLSSPDEWALIVPDKDIVVPLDRTVESLQGNHDLALVQRSTLGAQGGGALTGQSTNPNASIFKRFSEPAQPRYNKANNLSSIYKSYYVNRKMPMFVGRHERNLVLDGEWLHVIPTDTRAFQAHAGSFPISSVVSCKVSRIPTHFKVVVAREGADDKRYDFEAESQKQAAEIVNEINTLRNMALGR